MVEIGLIAYIIFSIGVLIWGFSDLPRYMREKRKRGKRDDYWRF
jgi:hypothetical protein